MKIRKNILAFMLGISIIAAGCNGADENNAAANTDIEKKVDYEQVKLDMIQPTAYGNVRGLNLEPGTTISLIGRGGPAAYWEAVEQGAMRAAEDMNILLGYKGDDKVKVIFSAPENENDVDGQVNILDEELARYPAAIGIAMVDSSACEVQFDLATENNIPIVAFDSGTNYQNIVSMIKTDDREAATMAANKLCDLIGDEGEILIIAHDKMSMTAQERESAFRETIAAKHPNVTIVDAYHLDELEAHIAEINAELPEEAQEDMTHIDVVKHILEKYPNVKAIYATSESAADVTVATLDELANEEMKVVSFDGGESQVKRLEEGAIDGLVVQNPFGIGYATVVAAARAVLDQGNEAVVDTGYTWVTESNLNDDVIKNMMY